MILRKETETHKTQLFELIQMFYTIRMNYTPQGDGNARVIIP